MRYSVNDKVVHPYHGAGVISAITKKHISGEMVECVVITLSGGKAGILLPSNSVKESGLRKVATKRKIDSAMKVLASNGDELPKDWRRRIDVLKERLNSGDPKVIATAIRDVMARSSMTKMNPSEKRVLNEAILVFAGELSLVRDISLEKAKEQIHQKVREKKSSKASL